MRDVSIDKAVTQLGVMIGQRFGVALQYESANEKSAAVETARRNSNAPLIIANNKMILPLRLDGVLVGAAQVHDVYSLSGKELSLIKDNIEIILGQVLKSKRSNVISFYDRVKPEVEAQKGSWTRAFAMD